MASSSRVLPRAVAAGARAVLAMASVAALLAGMAGCDRPGVEGGFVETIVDAQGPGDPWGKAVGDVDGDGIPDIVIGGHRPEVPAIWRRVLRKVGVPGFDAPPHGLLVWYGGADRARHVVSDQFDIRTDIEVADLDADGHSDIVAVTQQGLTWFRGPDWTPTVIDERIQHDVEVADLDGDGRLDLVTRNQQLFGHQDGDWLHFFRHGPGQAWTHVARQVQPPAGIDFGGEGLKVVDLDGDGRPEVVFNQAFLRNPGPWQDPATWELVPYCPGWNWPHAYLDVADLNADGRPDIVMAPAEPAGSYFRLSWCEAPSVAGKPWVEHVIDAKAETVMHGVAVGDLDGDGRLAVVAASMHVAESASDVAFYRPQQGGGWQRTVIGHAGSHSIKLADVDRDGDLDVIGANFSGEAEQVRLWLNQSTSRTSTAWRRHVIDEQRPWPSVFVLAGDLDGDGRPDLASGGGWYRNPGSAGGRWERREIGPGAHNVAMVRDFDRDGHADLLASSWNGMPDWSWIGRIRRLLRLHVDGRAGGFVFARNDGHGHFELHDHIDAGSGDFLQGIAWLPSEKGGRVALSWHQEGLGLQQIVVPGDPSQERWPVKPLAPQSQDEELTAVDLDGDGLTDLVEGSRWLRQSSDGTWTPYELRMPLGQPDRHRVGDLDGDGRLDVVIGDEAISKAGKLAWYRQPEEPTQAWREQVIGWFTGPMSVGLADMDGDGDPDVVIGEHDLQHPASARLFWMENRTREASPWVPHLIHTGDEHHDGGLPIDVDQDGDIDIVSIGWGHGRLLLYENLARRRE